MNFLGGKTKTGAVILVVGVAIYQTVDLCPIESWVPWIKWLGSIVTVAGGALGIVGIGTKVDRATAAVNSAQVSAQISSFSAAEELQKGPVPLTEESFRRILAAAKAQKEPLK